ncbi:MAG: hypothetical protein SP4CHLAM5_06480 [Chlamydiia bacterium]|nr:hypothetical protein [Chlamydiia bacterium]MCH9618516.1 hypothetical protein [Chlamydiia bacterium]MCH9623805.1 hypothetical protein [Chlamydiia bacterium]
METIMKPILTIPMTFATAAGVGYFGYKAAWTAELFNPSKITDNHFFAYNREMISKATREKAPDDFKYIVGKITLSLISAGTGYLLGTSKTTKIAQAFFAFYIAGFAYTQTYFDNTLSYTKT